MYPSNLLKFSYIFAFYSKRFDLFKQIIRLNLRFFSILHCNVIVFYQGLFILLKGCSLSFLDLVLMGLHTFLFLIINDEIPQKGV